MRTVTVLLAGGKIVIPIGAAIIIAVADAITYWVAYHIGRNDALHDAEQRAKTEAARVERTVDAVFGAADRKQEGAA